MADRIYRIDKKKEIKTIIVTSMVMLVVLTLFCFVVLAALSIAGKPSLISQGAVIFLFASVYGLILSIIIKNSQKDQKSWCLQIIDEDHFILTNTRQEPTAYTMSDLSRIDVRDDDTLFFYVRNPRKKVFIHDNLQQFDEVKAYFRAMKVRLKASTAAS